MIIKEAEFETCPHCQSSFRVTVPVIGCDVCKKEINDSKYDVGTYYSDKREPEYLQFCSMNCLLSKLNEIKNDDDINFVSMPDFDGEDLKELFSFNFERFL